LPHLCPRQESNLRTGIRKPFRRSEGPACQGRGQAVDLPFRPRASARNWYRLASSRVLPRRACGLNTRVVASYNRSHKGGTMPRGEKVKGWPIYRDLANGAVVYWCPYRDSSKRQRTQRGPESPGPPILGDPLGSARRRLARARGQPACGSKQCASPPIRRGLRTDRDTRLPLSPRRPATETRWGPE
jgi:hypothetical protein